MITFEDLKNRYDNDREEDWNWIDAIDEKVFFHMSRENPADYDEAFEAKLLEVLEQEVDNWNS